LSGNIENGESNRSTGPVLSGGGSFGTIDGRDHPIVAAEHLGRKGPDDVAIIGD
jgi:hypothetical protein